MLDNCPNCGAPRDGPVCAYCGTKIESHSSSSKMLDKLCEKELYGYNESILYANNQPVMTIRQYPYPSTEVEQEIASGFQSLRDQINMSMAQTCCSYQDRFQDYASNAYIQHPCGIMYTCSSTDDAESQNHEEEPSTKESKNSVLLTRVLPCAIVIAIFIIFSNLIWRLL